MQIIKIIDYNNYLKFLTLRVEEGKKSRRGWVRDFAESIQIHSTTFSQVLAGQRDLTPEQGILAARYLGLTTLETQYFLTLLDLARAGSKELQSYYRVRLEDIKAQATNLSRVLKSQGTSMSEEQSSTYYSSWHYSAIRNLVAVPGYQSPQRIAQALRLAPEFVSEAIRFLLEAGLLVMQGSRLEVGPKYTHVPAQSPHARRHHANWRIKALERHPRLLEDELAYTSPMSLSREDAARIRHLATEFVTQVGEIRDPSPSEAVYLLNLDWLRVAPE